MTTLGDIFVFDPSNLIASQLKENSYVQEIDLAGREASLTVPLHTHCMPGTTITLTGCIGDEADRIGINLDAAPTFKIKHKAHTEFENCGLHFNPRFAENYVVRNAMIEDKWGEEEQDGGMPLAKGQEFNLKFVCNPSEFTIYVDGKLFTSFRHRVPPETIVSVGIWGKVQPFKLVLESPEVIVDPLDLYWRQMGGHLRRVETCRSGVTWGIAYDHTAWVYTGGWGGGFLGALDSQDVHPMTDSQDYRVYENQRWNPVRGYTSSSNKINITP